MDQIPEVNPFEKGKSIENSQLKGEIKFQNVDFKYPTRPDIAVLKNFTCTFESGKTTALVG